LYMRKRYNVAHTAVKRAPDQDSDEHDDDDENGKAEKRKYTCSMCHPSLPIEQRRHKANTSSCPLWCRAETKAVGEPASPSFKRKRDYLCIACKHLPDEERRHKRRPSCGRPEEESPSKRPRLEIVKQSIQHMSREDLESALEAYFLEKNASGEKKKL
jgi:hypothetical protein